MTKHKYNADIRDKNVSTILQFGMFHQKYKQYRVVHSIFIKRQCASKNALPT